MIETFGDMLAVISMLVSFMAAFVIFYRALIQHREVYFQRREDRYYGLFEESDDSDFDDRDEPYYED
ncbi:MAG: hypothetical protein IJ225_07795 [Solobacterium sp.]|nr:hypothetical protein [Solobacterium sp.]